MAWYPGATKMELQPESDRQEAIRPTQLILHSIVANWTARRTYEFWRDSTTLESHFGIGYGLRDIAQYIGTETRADANAGANRRPDGTGAISVETASNSTATDPWNDSQVEELIDLGVWAHEEHDIPLRICRTHDDPGFGYHSMFPQWSTSGTACPGVARIKQFREVVFPGIVARANGQTTTPEETDVPHNLSRSDDRERQLTPGKWTTVPIGNVDLLAGATAYTVTAWLNLTATRGGTVQGRFYHSRPDGSRWKSPITERITTTGGSFLDFPHAGSIDTGERVRFEAVYYPDDPADETPVPITSSRARGLYWK
ncbi:N-acetylmuramoyl-L-alanine amidase [Streptomyces sp. NPDC002994]|uniref:N-acetylmuramoyl-L-alanine amidase n=1 Tax=Streptomyces sp. NPDC002994 TaxID=3154441 RepID=UPI0033A90516